VLSSSPTAAVEPVAEVDIHFAPGASFGERYTIVERIGVGGMGQVYKALDKELDRPVALKLVRSGTRRARGLERFRRELTLARQVSHPNVCRVHDLGDVEGLHYISMEYIEGQSLRDWTQAVGRLSTHQTVSLGRQLCAGLGAIHRQSIVHRDLKPSNVMLDRTGRAVVMDFGLAYHPQSDQITAEGEVLGTLAYLSPEQARGEQVDQRCDIYALGLVLFELLTGGRPPADGKSLPLALRDSTERCPPPSQVVPEVPDSLDRVVMRCLERGRASRFQKVDEVERALEIVADDLPSKPGALLRPQRPRPMLWGGLVATLVALGLALAIFMPRSPTPPAGPTKLAVLPLEYQGPEENAYLGNLIPLAIIRNLQSSGNLEVTPFESSRLFRPDEQKGSVARQLGVDWVVQGEIHVRDDGYGGALSLLPAAEGVEAGWSREFKGGLGKVLDVADIASLNIVDALGEEVGVIRADGVNPQALAHYVEGKSLLEGWDVERNHTRAAEAFSKALEVDENFAEAHAELAVALWTRYEETHESQLVEKAMNEAREAVTLAPSLPEAHLALGVVQLGRGRSAEAAASFQRARALAPADDSACLRIAAAYAALERNAEAERMYQRAIDLRPNFWQNYNAKGNFYLVGGQWEQAKKVYQRVIELRPENDLGRWHR